MTGVGFTNLFYEKVDNTYSTYYDPTVQLPLLFKEGLVKAIEKKYAKRSDQGDYDDLTSLIRTGTVFGINNNLIYTTAINISNITHIGTAVTVTTSLPHNILISQSATIANATGLTNVNGTFTVLTVPTTTTFTFTAGSLPAGTYTANSASLTYPNMVYDYDHLMALKAKYLEQYVGVSVTKATNATPIRITISGQNNIRSKQPIFISGVVGNTSANGYYYAKKINSTTIDLYSNESLTTPSSGNGTYASGGAVYNVFYKYCTPYYSERKIAHLTDPKVDRPKFEDSNNTIKVYPLDVTCQEITLDYVSVPTIFIDPLDNVLDLELYYPFDFLLFVVEVCKDIFFSNTKDFESIQKSQLDIQDTL